LRQSEAVDLIDALVAVRYIEQVDVDRFRPVLQLTADGQAVMTGRVDSLPTLSLAAGLVEKLCRAARATQAATPAVTPPKAVAASSAVRHDLSVPAALPTAPQPSSELPTLDRDGDVPGVEVDEVEPRESLVPAGGQPSHYWTWRLLAAGFAPEESAAIRGFSPDVVLDHALRAADCGWPVQAEWFLEPGLLARLEKLIGDEPPARIRPLLARLPAGTRYEHVQFFLKCRGQTGDSGADPAAGTGPAAPGTSPAAAGCASTDVAAEAHS
jgi:hypothetical protein